MWVVSFCSLYLCISLYSTDYIFILVIHTYFLVYVYFTGKKNQDRWYIVSEPSSIRCSAADCPISHIFKTFAPVVSNHAVVMEALRVFQQFSQFSSPDFSKVTRFLSRNECNKYDDIFDFLLHHFGILYNQYFYFVDKCISFYNIASPIRLPIPTPRQTH